MISDEKNSLPVALTIAGLDPSGGAGLIADIKTFTAFDCFPATVITSLTFQNTIGVFGASHQTAETVRAQVLPIIEDFRVAGVKTGMLPTREIIREVARLFRETNLPAPVVDPVVRSTSGYDLIDDNALAALIAELMPLARLVTPNIPEAERMTGLSIKDRKGMERAATALRKMGARAVLIKGGHLKSRDEGKGMRDEDANETREAANSETVIDVLDEDGEVTFFCAPRIVTTSTHGTGCTLSAAIAASHARGYNLEDSVALAKRYVTDALRHAPNLGHGHGPINHNLKAVMSDE